MATSILFRYARDPLFLGACAAYLLNRFLIAPASHSLFLRGYFDDLLLIPCALPLVLWVHRKFGWRPHDAPPTAGEIALHWGVWSLVCEGFGPQLLHRGVADRWDVVAYGAGALAAWLWWHWRDLHEF